MADIAIVVDIDYHISIDSALAIRNPHNPQSPHLPIPFPPRYQFSINPLVRPLLLIFYVWAFPIFFS